MKIISNPSVPYFVSWSGGKDSCLALFRAMQKYGKPQFLLTMMTEEGVRSRSHGLSKTVLEKQAQLLQIPILFYSASWQDYESIFIRALHDIKNKDIRLGIFGDMKISDSPHWTAHKEWAIDVCQNAGMTAEQPLWKDDESVLLKNIFDHHFVAKIISVKSDLLSSYYLGKVLDTHLINHFIEKGIHPLGEKGEYHTIVVDGPIFETSLALKDGDKILKDGYWFLDVS